jgi:hypothetical protein
LSDGDVDVVHTEARYGKSGCGICVLYLGNVFVQPVDPESLGFLEGIRDVCSELQSLCKNIVICALDAVANCAVAFEPPERVIRLPLDTVTFGGLVAERYLRVLWDICCRAEYEHVADKTPERISVTGMVYMGCKCPYAS